MDIADQMQDELQRDEPLAWRGRRVAQFGGKFLDLADDAVLGGALAGGLASQIRPAEAVGGRIRMVDVQVDEVPVISALAAQLPQWHDAALSDRGERPVSPSNASADIRNGAKRLRTLVDGLGRDDCELQWPRPPR